MERQQTGQASPPAEDGPEAVSYTHLDVYKRQVSRRHAEVRYDDGAYRAHDIGSLNGTYLNRERIDTASLASGDELQVGKFRLLFLAPGHGPGAGHAAGTA